MQNDEIKKTKLARKFTLVISLILVSISTIFIATLLQNNHFNLVINNSKLDVQIAKTSQEKVKGLCCRDSLPKNAGMLFVYEKPGIYSFWMKDTRIPLDMYWINSKKQIIYIEENVQPNSFPKTFGPKAPAQYILETNAGYARENSIKVGDTVTF